MFVTTTVFLRVFKSTWPPWTSLVGSLPSAYIWAERCYSTYRDALRFLTSTYLIFCSICFYYSCWSIVADLFCPFTCLNLFSKAPEGAPAFLLTTRILVGISVFRVGDCCALLIGFYLLCFSRVWFLSLPGRLLFLELNDPMFWVSIVEAAPNSAVLSRFLGDFCIAWANGYVGLRVNLSCF